MSPADRATMSPGTIDSIGISTKPSTLEARGSPPCRLTLAVVFTSARSLAAASFERCSWMKAVTMERITIVEMTTAALASPRKYDTTARVSSRPLSGFLVRLTSS
jgi:hypothetical protein